jgi:6-phosphogluconolactonase
LFPKHINAANETVHAIYNSPKPPSERISLSAKTLSHNTQVIFLLSEKNKQAALNTWKQGGELPVATIGSQNTIEVLIAKAS